MCSRLLLPCAEQTKQKQSHESDGEEMMVLFFLKKCVAPLAGVEGSGLAGALANVTRMLFTQITTVINGV